MSSTGKVSIKSFVWFKDLCDLILRVKAEPGSLKIRLILGRIPNSVLDSLDQKDLFEIIKEGYEDKRFQSQYPPYISYPPSSAVIAKEILSILSISIPDSLIEEYRTRFAKSELIPFLDGLLEEKRSRLAIDGFFEKQFPGRV